MSNEGWDRGSDERANLCIPEMRSHMIRKAAELESKDLVHDIRRAWVSFSRNLGGSYYHCIGFLPTACRG
jgi:hypothetical protein